MRTRYGRGLRPSTPSRIAHRIAGELHPAITEALAAGPKGSAQLTPCQRLDQGGSGTCHAHSAVGALWCALMARGVTPPYVGSPRMLSSCTYAVVRAVATPPGSPLPVLQDTGAELQDDATALATWGVAAIQAPTSDGRFSDVENDPPSNVFPEPDIGQLVQGSADLVGGEYTITVGPGCETVVAAALDAGIPVWLGCFVDTAFENLGPSDIAQPANQADPNGGGHALYISGYRTNSSGLFEFRVENSWGSSWADGGAVWASTAWLLACWDLWPFAVKVPS